MVKLSAELLLKTPSYLSPLRDRELDLRGHNIPAIENLGVTKNQLDSIDLTDNAITSLSNLPQLPRLKNLMLGMNPIVSISPNLARALPNLAYLVLTGSQIKDLKDLEPLSQCKRLEFLSLKESPVTRQPQYRLWVIFKCPNLRILDFEKVKLKEREHAKSLFQTADGQPTELAQTIAATSSVVNGASKAFNVGETTEDKGRLLTAEDKDRIRQAIANATSIEEVNRLRTALESGFVPSEKELAALRGDKANDRGQDMDVSN